MLHNVRDKMLLLEEMLCWLRDLERCMRYTAEPLPRWLETCARSPQYARLMFLEIVCEKLPLLGLEMAFCDAVEQDTRLDRAEKDILGRLGAGLGKSDSETQLLCIRETADGLQSVSAAQKRRMEKAQKLYVTLGASGGLALAVLLL